MANKGNEKVIAGIDAFAKEVATQIFNVHIIFDCEKWLLVVVYLPNHYLLNSLIKNMNEILIIYTLMFIILKLFPCKFRNDANLIGALYQHISNF